MFDGRVSDMRGVGICGVTGTGKREIAEAYAAETDHVLVPFDSDRLLSNTRIKFTTAGVIQEYKVVLAQLELAYADAPKRFITNITPLDVMTELYSMFAWFNPPSEEASKEIREAWADACRICSKYLSVIMLTQPLNCDTREEHLNALCAGLIHTRLVNETATKFFTVPRTLVDLARRTEALKKFVFDRYEEESPYEVPASLRH